MVTPCLGVYLFIVDAQGDLRRFMHLACINLRHHKKKKKRNPFLTKIEFFFNPQNKGFCGHYGRFGTKKCALLQCVFWRSRLTHAHHLWRKRVRRRYYRFVNRHLVSFVISESTNGVYMDWGRFYPRRCWGLLAVLPYGLCSFPSLHIRPQRGPRSPSPFMERGGRQAWGEVYPSPSSPASIAGVFV